MEKTKTLDNQSVASSSGGVFPSREKLKFLQPELYSPTLWFLHLLKHPVAQNPVARSFWHTRIPEQLAFGDSRAAVVVSTNPLIIAAYTDELDCVALLRFDQKVCEKYDLKLGTRLITINTYSPLDCGLAPDLEVGPNDLGRWGNFAPFIADFLTDNHNRLQIRKSEIAPHEWQRAEELGTRLLQSSTVLPRDSRPTLCMHHGAASPDFIRKLVLLLLCICGIVIYLARRWH